MSYEVVPECRGRGCFYTYYTDPHDTAMMLMQHGENPESVLRISLLFDGTVEEASRHAEQRYREFAERCHRYEDEQADESKVTPGLTPPHRSSYPHT